MKAKSLVFANVLTLITFFHVPAAWADEGGLIQLINDLQRQMAAMQETIDDQRARIEGLETRKPEIRITETGAPAAMSDEDFASKLKNKIGDSDKWLKDLKFSADVRLRYEAFDFTSGHPSETDPQNRFRFRLRYGFEKKFHPDMNVGFYLSSGGTSDPTSTNQTLDGNFVWKTHVIERAFASYTPKWAQAGPIERFEVTGGKFKNPFERAASKMVWDGDVRPEGIYEMVDLKLVDTEDFDLKGWATAGQFVLDEDSAATDGADAELYAYQIGLEVKTKPAAVKSGVSFYSYSDYATNSNFGAFARGNPNLTADGVLDAGDFDIVEIYNEVGTKVGNLPVKVFFDFAHNFNEGAPEVSLGGKNDAWALGLKLGKAKKKGEWEIGYDYRWIEPNSVVGAFNDSDFGNGHADKRGSVFGAKYMLTDNLQLAGTAFFVNNISANTILRDEEQRRFQLDLLWKF